MVIITRILTKKNLRKLSFLSVLSEFKTDNNDKTDNHEKMLFTF